MSGSSAGTDAAVVDGDVPAPRLGGRFEGAHIVVPLLTQSAPTVGNQVRVASALARAAGGSVSVISPLSDDDDRVRGEHADVAEALPASSDQLPGTLGADHGVVVSLLRTVRLHDVDTLVLPSGAAGGRLRTELVDRIAAHADCDVVVVNGRGAYESVASILLPIADGPHSGLATDLARSIAADCDAWVDVLHVVDSDPSARRRARAETLASDAARRIGRPDCTTTWVLEADDTAAAIVEQSRYYGLTVIGAPVSGRLRRFIYGSTNRSVRANARSVVLSACNNHRRTARHT